MSETCSSCGAPVLTTAAGPLNPELTRLGVLRADGTALSRGEVVAAHEAGRASGYQRHQCGETTAARPEQLGLFEISQTTTTTKERIK